MTDIIDDRLALRLRNSQAAAAVLRSVAFSTLLAVLLASLLLASAAQAQDWTEQRGEMLRTIAQHAQTLPSGAGAQEISPEVLNAMGQVPRHRFIPEERRSEAYADRPVPIGHGQTISQPFIVALMTELLQVGPEATVLEVGTGSGYQAAVLSPLVEKVCTIEIIPALAETAKTRFEELGYDNVETKTGDGYFGWPACASFDGIVVTAAAGHVPPPLVEQLKPGGRMVIPVGNVFGPQYLTLIEKTAKGQIKTRQLLPVRFVPLTRAEE